MKKRDYRPFRKHFFIPFSLSIVIIIIGVLMTLTNKTDLGYFEGRLSNRQDFVLTGPSVIGLGVLVALALLYYKKYLK